MIERNPDGTSEIAWPHKIFHWADGSPTLRIDCPTEQRTIGAPYIEGWECFFVAFFGYEADYMSYSYRPKEVASEC